MEYAYIIIPIIIALGCYWSLKYKPKKTINKAEGVKEQVRRYEEGHFEQYKKEGKDE